MPGLGEGLYGRELGMPATVAVLGFRKYPHADVVLSKDFITLLTLSLNMQRDIEDITIERLLTLTGCLSLENLDQCVVDMFTCSPPLWLCSRLSAHNGFYLHVYL